MRRILFLAYYFPPLGGAGVQRSVKFVQYLHLHGYETVVVTGPRGASVPWAPSDPSLAVELPAGTLVRRTETAQPARSTGGRARTERWLRVQTPFARWWRSSVTATGRAVSAEMALDVIYASMSPFETGEAAARLSRELGAPFVADLRDPWALDDWLVYPSKLHRRLELRRMRRTLAAADAIVMNTPDATREVRRRFRELDRIPVFTIPNGFDSADFSGPAPHRGDGAFRIVHAGYVHANGDGRGRHATRIRELLGGSVKGMDTSTRSHVNLLRAVERAVSRRPQLREHIEVHLAGLLSDADRHVQGFEHVRAHGYLPHDESVALLRSSELLFLPMHDLPVGTRSRIVPGKTYEYLAAARPILAAVPDGDARDLLASAGNASLCRPADVDGMARVILEQYDRFLRHEPAVPPRADIVAAYERRRLTAELAHVFDVVLGSSSPRTGSRVEDAAVSV